MADVPAWSSSTSYYSGQRDAEWDQAGASNVANPAYPGGGSRRDAGWAPPTHTNGNGANGYAANGYASSAVGTNGYAANGYAANGYAADPRVAPAAEAVPATSRSASRAQQRAIRQRGLPGWGALLVLIAIAGCGGVIDMASGNNVRGGFNIALVVASLVAILLVRHRDMFPIVVAPPLVYIVASGVMLYFRSGGLHDRHVLIDAAANWLVYGFPAIAGASAAVLIIAGVRLVIGK